MSGRALHIVRRNRMKERPELYTDDELMRIFAPDEAEIERMVQDIAPPSGRARRAKTAPKKRQAKKGARRR